MSSILTCRPFLHLLSHLGYRKRNSRSTSSMPPDGAPFTPTWLRVLSHGGHICFIIFSSVIEDGHVNSQLRMFCFKTDPGSRERRRQQGFFSYNRTFILYCFCTHPFRTNPLFWFAKKAIVIPPYCLFLTLLSDELRPTACIILNLDIAFVYGFISHIKDISRHS
jgi:hypothetical protein